MENNTQTEQREREEIQLQDTYNDDHWLKKYGVSSEELKSIPDVSIPARIIEVNNRTHALQA